MITPCPICGLSNRDGHFKPNTYVPKETRETLDRVEREMSEDEWNDTVRERNRRAR